MATKKINLNAKQQELYNELKKLSKRANQRLVRLERNFGSAESWAGKKLRDRLDTVAVQGWTKTGRVRLNKSMSITQMNAIIKATNQFLNSATSTKRGIEKQKKNVKKGIAKSLAVDDVPLTDEEAEVLYSMFNDDDFNFFVPKYMTSSEFWGMVEDAKEKPDTADDFIARMRQVLTFGNDEDLLQRIRRIYIKYVA